MAQHHNPDVHYVTPVVSVIVPARNEEACLERCLRSLVEQQGIAFEIIIIDDNSTDRTPEIIEKFGGVRQCPFLGGNPFLTGVKALRAGTLPSGWMGKSHAIWSAVSEATGGWLLLTDADTYHEPGSLARAVAEAREHDVDMLSYSPVQDVGSLAERALMPLIFSDLATTYRPKLVSDPTSEIAAANGQYILLKSEVYLAIGGHRAIATELLEDVVLAKRLKQAGGKLRFRYGAGQVRTRMYRTWDSLVEGWTKNLSLLFPNAAKLAAVRMAEFLAMSLLPTLAIVLAVTGHWLWALLPAAIAAPI